MRQRGDLIIVGLILGFNSRTPGGVRLAASSVAEAQTTFQFTHPGRGATRLCEEGAEDLLEVSIHAPREGCDQDKRPYRLFTRGFNSRTPGGVRLDRIDVLLYVKVVSIHAPREGCDLYCAGSVLHPFPVSIHAPREGCDLMRLACSSGDHSFNSRTPGGVRPTSCLSPIGVIMFQFTHPGRGATTNSQKRFARVLFQFTHPGRGATLFVAERLIRGIVSIHAPREGCDNVVQSCVL